MTRIVLRFLAPLLLAALAFGCTQKNTADEHQDVSGVPSGLERFLLFPNPIAQSAGGFETDTTAYAEAYYRAIDPNNDKDTLDKWKAQNGFVNSSNPLMGTEHLAVFRDVKDLGYGRRMTGRINMGNGDPTVDGNIAFFVENYNVAPGGSSEYSSDFNVDAAIRRDTQWHVGTNAIEWSSATCTPEDPPDCNPNARFAKYFNFSSADGTRQVAVDLDGKGKKAMPGPCITCHGGRGDPLTPPDAGSNLPRFPLVENSVSRKRGDVQARLHGQNVDSFTYSSTQAGFSKSDMQPLLRHFNQWIWCTYPTATPASVTDTWGTCNRPTAGANEWQGAAADLIEQWYGGPGIWQSTFQDTYVPTAWSGNPALYTEVVAPYCRTCHILRGTKNQNDIDFTALGTPAAMGMPATGFLSYADRIKSLVFERGVMPLALIVYDAFWQSSAPDTLAAFIDTQLGAGMATDSSGALRPGRPIADPGPNRIIRTNSNAILTAENSLFASTYNWSLVSGSATIANPNAMITTFLAPAAGTYTVRLTVSNGASTDSRDVVITADDSFPDLFGLRFAHVKNVLQNVKHNGTTLCISCHTTPGVNPTPPIFYNNFDRNGIGGVDTTDDLWFVKALRGRVNLTEIQASPLLRKPSGNHHNGGTLFDLATPEGLRNYSIFYNWILAGMPSGGVAANAVVNGGLPVPALTFGGTFPGPYSASISLDGSTSVGASNYFWSLVSGPSGPTGAVPSFANQTAAAATLNVPNVGTYVVQLQASDATFTDTDQRTITVSESPIAAAFTPPTGTTVVSFTGNPSTGNITLTSTSTGSPMDCTWRVTGPSGATLEGTAVPTTAPPAVVTRPCGTAATLNVPSTAINGTYVVELTASTIGQNTAAPHNITVGNGTPVVASIVANGGTNPAARAFTGGNPSTGAASTASVSLNGNGSSGVLPLTFSWSITAQPDSTNGAATFSSTTAAAPTLTVRATGSYTVRLQVTDAASNVAATTNTFSVTPTNGTTFATMTADFVSFGCTGCHFFNAALNNNPDAATNNTGTTTNLFRPSWENVNDVNGKTLWRRVFQRVMPGNTARSLIILNPQDANSVNNDNPTGAGYTTPHGGGCQTNFGCGVGDSSRLTIFQNWVNDGGPPGN